MADEDDKKILVPLKDGPNFTVYTNGLIRLKGGRFTYPYAQGQVQTNDKGNDVETWSTGYLMPKASHRAAKNVCVDAINKLLKENKLVKIAADRKFIKDGDESDKEDYRGHWLVNARSYDPILLYGNKKDKDGKVVKIATKDAKRVFYGGAFGSILIRPWFQNNNYGKRVNAGLVAMQFRGDGEPFGEGRISEDAIDDGGWDTDDVDETAEDDFDGL